MTGYVHAYGDLDPDPRDDDRWATDETCFCALFDEGDCDGEVRVRDHGPDAFALCDHHDRVVRSFAAGLALADLIKEMSAITKGG
jgi:hypothetical protein